MPDRKLPRLMGRLEIQERLGYSRAWTNVLTNRRDFPLPAYTLRMGRIWLAEDVEKWIDENRASIDEPEA